MMVVLFLLMVVLAVNSSLLPGATEGLKFYLLPDFGKLTDYPFLKLYSQLWDRLSYTELRDRSFSYLRKLYRQREKAYRRSHKYSGAGYLCGAYRRPDHFPACSAYGIDPGEGPGLVFVTLPNVFNLWREEGSGEPCSSCL